MADLIKMLQKEGLSVDTASRGAEVKGWLHSGNYALNFIMAGRFRRGYPLGHVTEVFGENSTGKSYLLARAMAEVQKAGGVALLDDVEGALNLDWATRLGIDVETLAYKRSRTVQEHTLLLDKLLSILEKAGHDKPVCVGLDSLAALSTDHELDTLEKGTKDMARAQEIHKLFRVGNALLKKVPTAHIVANHKIAAMNQFSRADSTGGGGAKYYSSMRIDLRTPKHVKDSKKDIVGAIVRAVAFKTRWTGAWKETELYIPYTSAISEYSGLIPILLKYDIVTEYGKNLVWDGEDTEIATNKSNFGAQDRSAEQLINDYPDILDAADAVFAAREAEITEGVTDDEDDQEAFEE